MSQLTPSVDPEIRAGEAAIGVPTRGPVRRGDRIFSGSRPVPACSSSGSSRDRIFCSPRRSPQLRRNEANFLTSREWAVGDEANMRFGIADLLGRPCSARSPRWCSPCPVAIGVALYITQYAPPAAEAAGGVHHRHPRCRAVDHLRPVGIQVLAPKLKPVSGWLQDTLGFIRSSVRPASRSHGVRRLRRALHHILPIVTAISREVFDQVPTPAHARARSRWARRSGR
jgi:phosphate transport system permease protein